MLHYLSTGPRDYHIRRPAVSVRSGWEFQAVLSGSMAACYPKSYSIREAFEEKHLWVFEPGIPHGWNSPAKQPCRIIVLHVDTENIPTPLTKACKPNGVLEQSLTDAQIHRIDSLFEDLKQHYPRLTTLTELHTQRMVIELATMLLKDQSRPIAHWTQNYNQQRVRGAMTWFSQNMNQHVGVHQMAEAVCVSPVHLRRLFEKTGHASPLKTINLIRLERAKHLLRDTDFNLAEIADAIGISGATVFCRWFKQALKTTPTLWRETSRLDQSSIVSSIKAIG